MHEASQTQLLTVDIYGVSEPISLARTKLREPAGPGREASESIMIRGVGGGRSADGGGSEEEEGDLAGG